MVLNSTRRMLWLALGGLVVAILGVGWDRAWHQRHAGSPPSGSEVLEAHWPMLLGVALMFVALFIAVRLVRHPRAAVLSSWVAFFGSLLMVVGFAWDSVRHAQGTESPTAHAMIYVGLIVVVIGIPASLILTRGFPDPSGGALPTRPWFSTLTGQTDGAAQQEGGVMSRLPRCGTVENTALAVMSWTATG